VNDHPSSSVTDPAIAADTSVHGRAAEALAAKLTFDRVERHFDRTSALKGISLEIEPGEIVCLLGPSGCGKTTLLRIASGIDRPSAGRILINDVEVAGPSRFVPPERRNVGLMFQDFALFPHLKVIDNVAFGLRALPKAEAHRTALAMLQRVGLAHHAGSYPHILSGGEQQRVALARALAPRPAVLLMDEPFSGLDIQLRATIQEETLALLRETRATCMMVTHNPIEAMRLGDRIAVMRAGRLLQVGRGENLYRNPQDLFVARLFSEINEIPCVVEDGALRAPFGVFSVPELNEGDRAVLCIRQRGIHLSQSGAGHRGRILDVRFLGDAALIELAVDGIEGRLKALVPEGEMRPRGTDVFVTIDPLGVVVFPAE
jgi:iron(III) transport system ATP-binding protein